MTAQHHVYHEGPLPIRTTLLELVQSLTRPGRTPDEVVRVAHDSIDRGQVVLIGNFRGGLGAADSGLAHGRRLGA